MQSCATTPIQDRMTLTDRGLVLGAGTLLAKLDGKALPTEADQERIWTLLAVAYGHEVPLAVLGSLRRVAKHWQGGDKCLAAIHLAQMGLPVIGKDAAYRLSLAAELLDAGVAPRELARELGFDPPAGLVKYDPDQPRVPAGSGRESGQWTSSGDAASWDAANYAVGVYMAGADYGLYESLAIAQAYAVFNSSNAFDNKYKGREWKIKGWEDAYRGNWR